MLISRCLELLKTHWFLHSQDHSSEWVCKVAQDCVQYSLVTGSIQCFKILVFFFIVYTVIIWTYMEVCVSLPLAYMFKMILWNVLQWEDIWVFSVPCLALFSGSELPTTTLFWLQLLHVVPIMPVVRVQRRWKLGRWVSCDHLNQTIWLIQGN